MAFTAIDSFVADGDARVVVQCDCGERLEIFDTLDAERAIDQATELHPCERCVACGEPASVSPLLDTSENAVPVHQACYLDNPQQVREALMAYFEKQEVA